MAFDGYNFRPLEEALTDEFPKELAFATSKQKKTKNLDSVLLSLSSRRFEAPALLLGFDGRAPSESVPFSSRRAKTFLAEYKKAHTFISKTLARGWGLQIVRLLRQELIVTCAVAISKLPLDPSIKFEVVDESDGDAFNFYLEDCQERKATLVAQRDRLYPDSVKRPVASTISGLGEAPISGVLDFFRKFVIDDSSRMLDQTDAAKDSIDKIILWIPVLHYLPENGIGPQLRIRSSEGTRRSIDLFNSARYANPGVPIWEECVNRIARLHGRSYLWASAWLSGLVRNSEEGGNDLAIYEKASLYLETGEKFNEEMIWRCTLGQATLHPLPETLDRGTDAVAQVVAYEDTYNILYQTDRCPSGLSLDFTHEGVAKHLIESGIAAAFHLPAHAELEILCGGTRSRVNIYEGSVVLREYQGLEDRRHHQTFAINTPEAVVAACHFGDYSRLEEILAAGVEIAKLDYGKDSVWVDDPIMTLFHSVSGEAATQRISLLELLLANGVRPPFDNPNLRNTIERTGRPEILAILNRFAPPDLKK